MRISDWSSDVCSSDLSNIGSLEDLPGHSIAFQNSASTSAYFVPATELLERGLPMEILLSPMDRPAAGSVGYLFARSELNISTWVDKRLVDAGVMSNLDWDNPRRMPPAYRASMKIIYQTRSEEHTSELQSLMRTSYAVFCLKKKK